MIKGLFKTLSIIIIFISGFLISQPQKIVTLAPGYTYQLFKLKRGDAVIANTTYCNMPEAARDKPKIGSVTNVNVEKIYALQPDLVITSTLTRKNQIEKLKQLGCRVEVFYRPTDYNAILKQYKGLAKLVAREELAQRQLDSLKTIIAKVRQKMKDKQRPKIFFQIGSNPLYAANQNSFLNDLIKMANGINVVNTGNTGAFSRETIIAQDPDHIFIALNDQKNKLEKQKWQKFNSIEAVQQDNIHTVDPNIFCTPTPFTFTRALVQMVNTIYPDIKN